MHWRYQRNVSLDILINLTKYQNRNNLVIYLPWFAVAEPKNLLKEKCPHIQELNLCVTLNLIHKFFPWRTFCALTQNKAFSKEPFATYFILLSSPLPERVKKTWLLKPCLRWTNNELRIFNLQSRFADFHWYWK